MFVIEGAKEDKHTLRTKVGIASREEDLEGQDKIRDEISLTVTVRTLSVGSNRSLGLQRPAVGECIKGRPNCIDLGNKKKAEPFNQSSQALVERDIF